MNDLANLPKGWTFDYQVQSDGNIWLFATDGKRTVKSEVIDSTAHPADFRQVVTRTCDELAGAARNRVANRELMDQLFGRK